MTTRGNGTTTRFVVSARNELSCHHTLDFISNICQFDSLKTVGPFKNSLHHLGNLSRTLMSQIPASFAYKRDEFDQAVFLYTIETEFTMKGQQWYGIYHILNEDLRSNDRTRIQRWKCYIYYLLHGVRRCPRLSPNSVIYRGMQLEKTIIEEQYKEQSAVYWSGFSSCSLNPDVATQFTEGQERVRTAYKTICELKAYDAYDISHLSKYPGEQEVLLLPTVQLAITSIEMKDQGWWIFATPLNGRLQLNQKGRLTFNNTDIYELYVPPSKAEFPKPSLLNIDVDWKTLKSSIYSFISTRYLDTLFGYWKTFKDFLMENVLPMIFVLLFFMLLIKAAVLLYSYSPLLFLVVVVLTSLAICFTIFLSVLKALSVVLMPVILVLGGIALILGAVINFLTKRR